LWVYLLIIVISFIPLVNFIFILVEISYYNGETPIVGNIKKNNDLKGYSTGEVYVKTKLPSWWRKVNNFFSIGI
jgi:hypothetical protein